MSKIVKDGLLTIPLYHGTSSIFLDSIFEFGLGGKNIITDWKVLEAAREIFYFAQTYCKSTNLWRISSPSFERMVNQESTGAGFNFQHGNVYLSPNRDTCIRYATKKDGSELISYTMDFFDEVKKLNQQKIVKDLCRKYPELFKLVNTVPAPILIEIRNIATSSLLDEHGNDPQKFLDRIDMNMNEEPELAIHMNQQLNFRLKNSFDSNEMKVSLINVANNNRKLSATPTYSLYKIISGPD